MKNISLIIVAVIVFSGQAHANCAAEFCKVISEQGKVAYFEYGSCSAGQELTILLTDSQDNELRNAHGRVTVLPSGPTQWTSSPQSSSEYVLTGSGGVYPQDWIEFKTKGGFKIFRLDRIYDQNGATGILRTTVPGFVSGKVSCE